MSRLEWLEAHGVNVPAKTLMRALPPHLINTLTEAQKKKLGPVGVQRYLQRMAAIAGNPFQEGLYQTHAGDRPWTLGQAGITGNAPNITINVYSRADDPKKVAVEVRNILQKQSKRNASSSRGRNPNHKVGLR
jgi:hypothetical protein